MLDVRNPAARRALAKRGAAEWCDSSSDIRRQARAALADSPWSPATIERALDGALLGFDAVSSQAESKPPVEAALAILPGNVIGPALCCAYCAAFSGTRLIMKSARDEQRLAPLIQAQFERLGAPLAGSLEARYWAGGDDELEADLFRQVQRIVVFGADKTVQSVRERAPAGVSVVGYADSASLGFVAAGTNVEQAAESASWDVAMFDQRGCMSPQTVYVEGDDGRALLFAHGLAAALKRREADLPRARLAAGEDALLADLVRRLELTALPPRTHGLPTLYRGGGSKSLAYVVAVQPFGSPALIGFGRCVVVMACAGLDGFIRAAGSMGTALDTIGVSASDPRAAALALASLRAHTGAKRLCPLGEMQRPPFGYRPSLADFWMQP